MKFDMPGPDRRVELETLRETGVDAAFAPDLSPPFELVVELGYGRGEFLMEMAAKRPEIGFLGVELSRKRSLKMARRVARTELANLRLVQARAEEVVRDVLPEGRVHELWINFPDPWPKARHQRRRLVQPAFVARVVRCLEPGGALQVATDHEDYAVGIDLALRGATGLRNQLAPEPYVREVPGRSITAYEAEWRAEGRPLHFFSYRKV